MQIIERIHRQIDRILAFPPIRQVLLHGYDRQFAQNERHNLFRGVFASFDAAQRTAPPSRPLGYDNPDAAAMYMNRTKRVYATDYPMLFWLDRLLAKGQRTIVDLGGHIGVSFYSYASYLRYPPDMSWTVLDVPAVALQGRQLAKKLDSTGQLGFTDQVGDADGADVLLALGSLQYLPDTLPERLAKLKAAPTHLLLNLVPIHAEYDYFTLQSIGTAFCPYHIIRLDNLVRGLEALGYTLVDQWENPEKKCTIPFQPKYSLDEYRGFFFSRRKTDASVVGG